MHRRFRGARSVTARAGEVEFEVVIAQSPMLRFLGLMGVEAAEMPALLFPRCRSLHAFWMRSEIDVVWLDLAAGRVLRVDLVPRRRTVRAPKGNRSVQVAALELAPGRARDLGLASGVGVSVAL